MRINAHAHVFNLASIFTEETARILLNRLKLGGMPDFLREVLADKLDDFLSKKINREELLTALAERVDVQKQLADLLKKIGAPDAKIDLAANGVLTSATGRLADYIWERLLKSYDRDDKGEIVQNWLDYLDFLRLALEPSVADVTDAIMKQHDDDDALVALMMDITDGSDDDRQVRQQIDDTSDMILAYPGRIFPFVMANPVRPNCFALVQEAIEQKGCWGVKLYPSLGYSPSHPELLKVYAYCAERQIPLLMHCSDGGYAKDKETAKLADPALWRDIFSIKGLEELKICFAHFGGDVALAAPGDIPTTSWTRTILDLINKDDRRGVYADISYHSLPLLGDPDHGVPRQQALDNYKRHFGECMADGLESSKRILFGTDTIMVRMLCTEGDYWSFYEKQLGACFKKLTVDNPKAFLGLPDAVQPSAFLIQKHLSFFSRKKMRVQREPHEWLKAAAKNSLGSGVSFVVTGTAPTWSRSDAIHKALFKFLWDTQIRKIDQDRKLTFEQYGRFKLYDLDYWDAKPEQSAFDAEVRAVCNQLDAAIVGYNDIQYNKNNEIKSAKARARLRSAFANGAMYIYELAQLCNQLYVCEPKLN